MLCETVPFQDSPFKLYITLAIFEIAFFSELLLRTGIFHNSYLQEQPPEVFYKKKLISEIRQYSQENICEYCEIFKNIYFEEHLQTTVSELKGFFRTTGF